MAGSHLKPKRADKLTDIHLYTHTQETAMFMFWQQQKLQL